MNPFTTEVEDVRARQKNAFATFYFTLLSVIQGVALAALFAKVDSLISRQSFHAPQIVLAISIFLVIVVLWNQYQMGINLYSWTATLFDAFIPFTLGVFEFVMIIGMEHGTSVVLIAFGTFSLVGLIAYEHQYWQIRKTAGTTGEFMQRLTAGFRALDEGSALASALVFFVTAALVSRSGPTPMTELAGAWIIVALAVGQLIREVYEHQLVLRRLAEMSA